MDDPIDPLPGTKRMLVLVKEAGTVGKVINKSAVKIDIWEEVWKGKSTFNNQVVFSKAWTVEKVVINLDAHPNGTGNVVDLQVQEEDNGKTLVAVLFNGKKDNLFVIEVGNSENIEVDYIHNNFKKMSIKIGEYWIIKY